MNFELSEDHKALRDMVRRLAKEVVAPRAAELDRTGEYPEDIFTAFAEAGLTGIVYPEAYGGSGLGLLGLVLAVEEVAKYCAASGLILLLTRLPGGPILYGGSEAQKQKYLRGIAEGKLRGAFCLTESSAGSDAANIKTTAVRDGDSYVLNGTKVFISGATVANFFTVAAKTDPTAGSRGMSVFVVDRDTPGVSIGHWDEKMGVIGVPTAEVIFDNVRVPAANLLGKENQGFKLIMKSLNSVRPVVAARGVGIAEGALEYAVEYMRNRQAFGQPIIHFQGLRWMIAEDVMKIQAARWLTYHAATLVDQNRVDRDAAPYLSMAKATATETGVKVVDDALQMLGGAGYMKDHPLERFYRDAKQLMIVEGTSQVQREIISRDVVDHGLPWTRG